MKTTKPSPPILSFLRPSSSFLFFYISCVPSIFISCLPPFLLSFSVSLFFRLSKKSHVLEVEHELPSVSAHLLDCTNKFCTFPT
jgi:hypothetical protein